MLLSSGIRKWKELDTELSDCGRDRKEGSNCILDDINFYSGGLKSLGGLFVVTWYISYRCRDSFVLLEYYCAVRN